MRARNSAREQWIYRARGVAIEKECHRRGIELREEATIAPGHARGAEAKTGFPSIP